MSRLAPLRGRRVLVTRGTGKADRLGDLLEAAGAEVVHVPLIVTEVLAGRPELEAALARLRDGHPAARSRWLVLTSEVGAGLIEDALAGAGLAGVSTAVVGPATASALSARGVAPDLVASGETADDLAVELVARVGPGDVALVIAASGGRNVVAPALTEAGAAVEVVTAYRSVMPPGAAEQLRAALATSPPDAVTFTSGSTVRHFGDALGDDPVPDVAALCIGPTTASAARAAGWRRVVTAEQHTAEGLVAAATASLPAVQPLP